MTVLKGIINWVLCGLTNGRPASVNEWVLGEVGWNSLLGGRLLRWGGGGDLC